MPKIDDHRLMSVGDRGKEFFYERPGVRQWCLTVRQFWHSGRSQRRDEALPFPRIAPPAARPNIFLRMLSALRERDNMINGGFSRMLGRRIEKQRSPTICAGVLVEDKNGRPVLGGQVTGITATHNYVSTALSNYVSRRTLVGHLTISHIVTVT